MNFLRFFLLCGCLTAVTIILIFAVQKAYIRRLEISYSLEIKRMKVDAYIVNRELGEGTVL